MYWVIMLFNAVYGLLVEVASMVCLDIDTSIPSKTDWDIYERPRLVVMRSGWRQTYIHTRAMGKLGMSSRWDGSIGVLSLCRMTVPLPLALVMSSDDHLFRSWNL